METQTPKSLSSYPRLGRLSTALAAALIMGLLPLSICVGMTADRSGLLAQTAEARNGGSGSQEETAKWRRATSEDCDAEIERQLRWMSELGICCDPPISLGMYMASYDSKTGASSGQSEQPCGYVDNSNPPRFRSRYLVWKNGKETELPNREAYERATCANVYTWNAKGEKVILSPKPEWTECRPRQKGRKV